MLIHREALELAKNAAPLGDGIPYSISCLNVTEDGAVTVTDGRCWLRMKAAVDEPNLFDELADLGAGAESDGPVMIPADVMTAFAAAMKKKKTKKGMPVPHVVVARKGDQITLASSDGKTKRTFLIEPVENVQFPDVEKTVLAHAPVRHITLGVDLLYTLLRTLRSCGAVYVKLGLPVSDEGPISLSTFTLTGPIDGAIMPMRDPEPAK